MKKLFTVFALAMTMCIGASAQNAEVCWSGSLPAVNGSLYDRSFGSQNRDFYSFGLGFNRFVPFSKNGPWKLALGVNFQYGFSSGNNDYSSQFSKFQFPLSLVYVVSSEEDVEFDPYAGFNVTYFTSGESEIGNSRMDWFPGCNSWNAGFHLGVDLVVSGFVMGFEYQHDLTNFCSKKVKGTMCTQKWQAMSVKVGYRF